MPFLACFAIPSILVIGRLGALVGQIGRLETELLSVKWQNDAAERRRREQAPDDTLLITY